MFGALLLPRVQVITDANLEFHGLVVAGPAAATPAAQAVLAPADSVREFLKANGIKTVGGSSDAKASVVRVICVRK